MRTYNNLSMSSSNFGILKNYCENYNHLSESWKIKKNNEFKFIQRDQIFESSIKIQLFSKIIENFFKKITSWLRCHTCYKFLKEEEHVLILQNHDKEKTCKRKLPVYGINLSVKI